MKPWHGIDGHVMADLLVENMASRERWGQQDHPLGIEPNQHTHVAEIQAKREVEEGALNGTQSWAKIIGEEFAEFLNAPSEEAAYQELVQLANVAFLAAESYKRARRTAWLARQASVRGQRATQVDTGGAT